jgi:hypothetical protein
MEEGDHVAAASVIPEDSNGKNGTNGSGETLVQ